MTSLDRKYVVSLDGVVKDLSNANVINLANTSPQDIGETVHVSKNGEYAFIASKYSVASANGDGDVFVYHYNTSTQSWEYEASLYSALYDNSFGSELSDHENTTELNFGGSIATSSQGTKVFVGISGYK